VTHDIVYLALGDSYTIGTGASHESRNFPSLLAGRLEAATSRRVLVVNPAVNGFTTLDLLAWELQSIGERKPDIVSVLIGVNDLVQRRKVAEYRESLVGIYEEVARLGLPAGRVAAISIPDWSVAPAARDFGDPDRIRTTTESFNAAAREEAVKRGFVWVDITAASVSGFGSTGWIASDRLHPGDAQYEAWSEAIWAVVGDAWTGLARP
jgi:lysophospholipase L1-like esterase